jgi:O-antigen/teichoic acid export membrane protein
MPSNNKRIAKNTILLYGRMLFLMFISLFTSRIILQALGVEDYGTYQAVGGVVGLMAFINGALATGSSRFLTYELGAGDKERLKKMFSTVLSAHIILGLIIVLLGETVGLWFVTHKLIIPQGREFAALFCYHLSIISCFFTVTQVPYGASIVSHEKMDIYAYMSILDAVLKLAIVYAIYVSPFDKLITYATLFGVVGIAMMIFYRWYCVKHFEECHFKFFFDKDMLKSVLTYSGWNLFANTAIALVTQGTTVLINMFFNPGVVAARAIANQVNQAANQFINNFRTAANPQIVKMYAAKDYEGSKKLLISSTKFSYFLMLILALPIALVARPLLQLWLGQVPPYSVIFLQITIATSLFQVFDSSFYTALYAKGRIKENAMLSPTTLFVSVGAMYLSLKLGAGPTSVAWILLIAYAILGLIIKPILIIKIVNYSWKDIMSVYIPCLYVTLISVPLPCFLYLNQEQWFPNTIVRFCVITFVSVLCVGLSAWFLGIDKEMREKVIKMVKGRLHRG